MSAERMETVQARVKCSLGKEPLLYPLPVLLVATYDAKGRPNVMNAAWGGICNSDPVSLCVSIRPSRHSHDALLARQAFTVNIASEELMRQADYVGMVSGNSQDKFAQAGLSAIRAQKVDAPYVAECPVNIECRLTSSVALGSHTLMIGSIEDVKVDEPCLQDGSPVLEKIKPLVYDMGSRHYYGMGGKLGPAFSVGREFIKK